MIKTMLILWYVIVGTLWLGVTYLLFDPKSIEKVDMDDIVTEIIITPLFLAFALMPNFIWALIQ